MARYRRRVRRARVSSRAGYRFRRSRGGRRGGGSTKSGLMWLVGAGIYGAGRAKIAGMVEPLTSKIPLGSISDNVGMLGVAWAAKKFIGGRVPLVNDIANAAMLVEAAQIGQELATNGFKAASGNGNGGSGVVYYG